jgi:enoyl-CoA hydratase/carnithine racemase
MTHDVEREDGPHGALVLRFTAAERRNSLRLETVTALSAGLADDPHRSVVLASSTPGIFCAGADLRIGDRERAQVSDGLYALYEQIVTRPGTVVALVDGAAVGGGAQLAAAADLRLISRRARFRWVGPGHGLAVGAWILPELVGRTAALELTLTSRWVEAADAVRLGLATDIAERPDERLATVMADVGEGDPSALARVKRIALGDLLERLRLERRLNADAWDGQVPARPAPGV